ncbi:Transposon Ty3-G Gag-Pol polyprotein [Araneus ventricosus]|uniref:Transposon Ty3-G Gag-Pol polyprotein n=1 Tax=Araneus ventricosus TaxID=182803 RepID=A0A4Y2ILM1_ARAVE|nr:Transposon Ty3-G Gag-Pol polyprotein [Araneus ventricosus]
MILVDVAGKDPRPCIDYRKFNKKSKTQFFALPNIEQIVETVAATKYISVLDLTKGYWRIPLTPKAQRIATFVTSFGTFRPLRRPFGPKNAPFTFSKMMADILHGCDHFAVPYLDDFAIYSNSWEEILVI